MRRSPLKSSSLIEELTSVLSRLPPNSALPSERSLADQYGVSRVTLRKALAELADDGLIYTIHGAGSFVAEPRVIKRLKLLSFGEEIRSRGLVPSTKVISAERLDVVEIRAGGDFNIIEGANFKIVRLRLGNDKPLSHETTLISEHIAPGLLDHDLTQSIYALLRERYNVKFEYAEEQIRPIVVGNLMAEQLQLKPGDPAFEIKRSAYTSRGELIERSQSIRPGERWSFKYSVKA
jgi:GntR family transcriptional regulator